MFDDNAAWIWWKRYGEHFTAPLILIALIILGFMLYDDNQLKKEIGENCGWGEDDYFCYCEKSKAIEMRNMYENKVDLSNLTFIGGNKSVTLDG
jgi:hypothetical protein